MDPNVHGEPPGVRQHVREEEEGEEDLEKVEFWGHVMEDEGEREGFWGSGRGEREEGFWLV